jgi:hypothetical protein
VYDCVLYVCVCVCVCVFVCCVVCVVLVTCVLCIVCYREIEDSRNKKRGRKAHVKSPDTINVQQISRTYGTVRYLIRIE